MFNIFKKKNVQENDNPIEEIKENIKEGPLKFVEKAETSLVETTDEAIAEVNE